MLGDLAGEVISSIVGDGIIELLFPGVWKPERSLLEGQWNASLGSLSAFLASVAAIFCGLATLGILRGMTDTPVWVFLGGAGMLAILAGVLAHRALEVTNHRRALARFGLWLSRATVLTGILAAALSIAGVTGPSL
jgi:uncharacterized membrane protein